MSLVIANNLRFVICLFVIYGLFTTHSPTSTLLDRITNLIIPQVIAAPGDGKLYFVHNNHLGTPVSMTNEAGEKVWNSDLKPFGKTTVNTDVDGDGEHVELNARFPGQQYDKETGLHYNYYRYYNPSTGRYMTSDPIGLSGGLNTYGYVGGNPLGFVDPKGLEVRVNARNVRNTAGLGAHTSTNVTNSSGSSTYGSYKVNGQNKVVKNDPSDHGPQRDAVTATVVVPPPKGMTQAQWDNAVKNSGDNLLNNLPPTRYEISPDNSAEGNCHTTTNSILDNAGGGLPPSFNPPGWNPGL